jgi:phage terminase small subunit
MEISAVAKQSITFQKLGGTGETITCPLPSHVPDWSDETMALMEELTPLQQTFVAWIVAGKNMTESYRLASGRMNDPSNSIAPIAHNLKKSPKIKAAIAAATRDRNFGARMDREWMLMKCMAQIEECENSTDIRRKNAIPQLIRLVAELKGEITQKHEHKIDVEPQQSDVRERMDRLIEAAERLTGFNQTRDGGGGETRIIVPPRPALGAE